MLRHFISSIYDYITHFEVLLHELPDQVMIFMPMQLKIYFKGTNLGLGTE